LETQWDPWKEFRRWQREMNRLFDSYAHRGPADFPPVNVWKSADGVVVTAEVPGITPDELDVTVVRDTVTLKGTRQVEGPAEGKTFHRRERGSGRFVRSLQLPYEVDASKVSAKYERGIVRIELPRAEAERPKRITVK
jgi:HSP20 family protein